MTSKRYLKRRTRSDCDTDYNWDEPYDVMADSITVFEQDGHDTGVLDSKGNRIVVRKRQPIGFVHHGD